MDTTKATAVLFDFDGVVVDTETQYSHFWHEMGKQYLGMDDIEGRVKGQTLVYIYDTFFPGMAKEQAEITERLNRFEQEMSFDLFPECLTSLPTYTGMGEDCRSDQLQRSEDGSCLSGSSRNKDSFRPYPYGRDVYGFQACTGLFLLGMEVFGTTPDTTYVFEDSFNGLKAGMASGATVIGLATTNSREDIAPLCHYVLDDFQGFTYDKLTQLHK